MWRSDAEQGSRAFTGPPGLVPTLRRMHPGLGTFVEVGASGAQAESAVEAAFRQIERAQRLWSFHDPDSDLSCLNAAPGRWVPVQRETIRLLRLCRVLMRVTRGAFNPTVAETLIRQGALPDHGWGLGLGAGDVDDIECAGKVARWRRPVRVTLDGVAKGYAVDLAVGALRRAGVSAGWVNAGGDLRAFGDVHVPVQRREAEGRFVTIGMLNNAALATSWVPGPMNAEDERDRFPARIVDAQGRLGAAGTWTVLARSAWRADALTKVAAVLPAPEVPALLARCGAQLWKNV